jgi:hypothetical protein
LLFEDGAPLRAQRSLVNCKVAKRFQLEVRQLGRGREVSDWSCPRTRNLCVPNLFWTEWLPELLPELWPQVWPQFCVGISRGGMYRSKISLTCGSQSDEMSVPDSARAVVLGASGIERWQHVQPLGEAADDPLQINLINTKRSTGNASAKGLRAEVAPLFPKSSGVAGFRLVQISWLLPPTPLVKRWGRELRLKSCPNRDATGRFARTRRVVHQCDQGRGRQAVPGLG